VRPLPALTLLPYTTLFRSSNVETDPAQVVCRPGGLPGPACDQRGRSPVEIITSRDVPLGGPRAMKVRRTLPQRQRSLIGPWCFRSEEHTSELQSRFDLVCR